MADRKVPVRSASELAGPVLALLDTLLTVAALLYKWRRLDSNVVIGAMIVLSLLAFALSAVAGRWWARVVGAALGVACLWTWLLVCLGANM